jgi:diguanylate cyclase (GGDEF)-like protein
MMQPIQGKDIAAFVFGFMAILYFTIWRRDRETGMGWFALGSLLTAYWVYAYQVIVPTGPYMINASGLWLVAMLIAAIGMGLTQFIAADKTRNILSALIMLSMLLYGAMVLLGLLFSMQFPRIWGGYLVYLAFACMSLMLFRANRAEPGVGLGWIAAALLSFPVYGIWLALLHIDTVASRYAGTLPVLALYMSVLSVGILRRRRALGVEREALAREHRALLEEAARRRLVEQQLREALFIDEPSGVPSHYAQRLRLDELIASDTAFSLFIINIRHLRRINENFGQTEGNRIIRFIANTIKEGLNEDCELARVYGGDFTIIVRNNLDRLALEQQWQHILDLVEKPLRISDLEIIVHLSVGLARFPVDAQTSNDLFRVAMLALHQSRLSNTGDLVHFEIAMERDARDMFWLDHHIRRAIDAQQFCLHYQPKVNLADGRLSSVEALIRWQHPERGNIPPDHFIHRAEANGQIVSLGRWIIAQAAQQAAEWLQRGHPIRIAVNVSAKQISDTELPDILAAAQSQAGGMLDIELTESCLFENERHVEKFIATCRRQGFGVHLDDFGTGYSSLSRLGTLSLTMIKIDKSFVTPLGHDHGQAQALIKAAATLAKELGLQTVAEGVETEEQVLFLRQLHVDYAQGWYYAKAMPAAALENWLQGQQTPARLA